MLRSVRFVPVLSCSVFYFFNRIVSSQRLDRQHDGLLICGNEIATEMGLMPYDLAGLAL